MAFSLLQSETSLTDRRKKGFAFAVLAVLILLTYANTFNASWHFDDFPNIVERPGLHMTELSWPQIKQAFFDKDGRLYRPIACLTFALNHLFGRLDVLGYHVVNVSIHLAASLFLFLFLHLTLQQPGIREKHGGHAYSVALLATVLWAVHPIQTQAVTYIIQRMASLAGLFYIMAMYLFAKARMSDSHSRAYFWFAACALSSLLAFGSKQNAFVLPVTLLLYDQLISGREFWSRNRRRITLNILLLSLAVLLGLLYYHVAHGDLSSMLEGYGKRVFSLTERLLTQPRMLVFYLSLLIYPSPMRLSIVHDVHISTSLFSPISTLFSILLICALIGGALAMANKRPLIGFAVLFFFVNHAIESTVFPLELIFEHRNYIPSMLVFLPVAMLIVRGLSFFSYKTSMRVLFAGFVILCLVGVGNATYLRNVIWKSDESLWMDALDKHPDLWLPYLNLGKYYADTGQTENALNYFRRGLGKKSVTDLEILFYYKTHFNLGSVHLSQGREQEALHHFLKASSYGIKDANQHILIASILIDRERYRDAETRLARALADEPEQVDSFSNLGLLYAKLGRPEKAKTMLRRALEQAPHHGPTLSRLGLILMREKQYGRATPYIEQAINSNPKDLLNHIHLACLYSLTSHSERAEETLDNLLDRAPTAQVAALIERLASTHPQAGSLFIERQALSLLAEACKRSARRYQALAGSCSQAGEALLE
jgi:protein O-mannosyl-transferase